MFIELSRELSRGILIFVTVNFFFENFSRKFINFPRIFFSSRKWQSKRNFETSQLMIITQLLFLLFVFYEDSIKKPSLTITNRIHHSEAQRAASNVYGRDKFNHVSPIKTSHMDN